MSKEIRKELREALDKIFEVEKEVRILEDERMGIDKKIKERRALITGYKLLDYNSFIINKINRAIDALDDFKEAVVANMVIHNGHKIVIPMGRNFVEGTIRTEKVFMIAEESNNEM